MNAGRVDRLLNVHVVIDHVRDHIEHGIDNRRPAGAADCEPERTVFAQHECRSHCRQRPLARRDRVALALNQAVEIRRAGLGSEVIHLVVHDQPSALRDDRRAV